MTPSAAPPDRPARSGPSPQFVRSVARQRAWSARSGDGGAGKCRAWRRRRWRLRARHVGDIVAAALDQAGRRRSPRRSEHSGRMATAIAGRNLAMPWDPAVTADGPDHLEIPHLQHDSHTARDSTGAVAVQVAVCVTRSAAPRRALTLRYEACASACSLANIRRPSTAAPASMSTTSPVSCATAST